MINSIVYNNEGGETLINISKKKKLVIVTIKDNGPELKRNIFLVFSNVFIALKKVEIEIKVALALVYLLLHIMESHKQRLM